MEELIAKLRTKGSSVPAKAVRSSLALCERRIMRELLLLSLVFFFINMSGCTKREPPENNSSDYTVTNIPLSVTIRQVSLSKLYGPDAIDKAQFDIWCLLERTDSVAISEQNNITLGGLLLTQTNGQRIPPRMTSATLYDPNNIPWEFYSGRGKKFTLKDSQRLLHYRLFPVGSDLLKVSRLNVEIRLGITGQDQKLRSFLFEGVLVR